MEFMQYQRLRLLHQTLKMNLTKFVLKMIQNLDEGKKWNTVKYLFFYLMKVNIDYTRRLQKYFHCEANTILSDNPNHRQNKCHSSYNASYRWVANLQTHHHARHIRQCNFAPGISTSHLHKGFIKPDTLNKPPHYSTAGSCINI